MSLPAGELNHRLRLQRRVTADDGYSDDGAAPWVDVLSASGKPVVVYARRTNMLRAAAEALASGGEVAPVQARFDMRPRQLEASWRLIGVGGDHDGVIYDIKNIGISNDRSEMAVIVVSGASRG